MVGTVLSVEGKIRGEPAFLRPTPPAAACIVLLFLDVRKRKRQRRMGVRVEAWSGLLKRKEVSQVHA